MTATIAYVDPVEGKNMPSVRERLVEIDITTTIRVSFLACMFESGAVSIRF